MKYRKFSVALLLFGALVFNSCDKNIPPGSHTKKYSAAVATQWFKLLTDITRSRPYVPPQTVRILSYSGLALYESVVKGMPSYQSMYTKLTGDVIPSEHPRNYYWPAVANSAIASIAPRLMAYYGPNPSEPDMQNLEQTFNAMFLTEITQQELDRSAALGVTIAERIFEWSKSDGTLNPDGTLAACAPYTPLGQPGSWEPTPPTFFPGVGKCQGTLRTFIPGIAADVLPPPPPAYSTDPHSTFYQAAEATFNMRNNMTVDDQKISESWQDLVGTNYNTPAHVVNLTVKLIENANLNLEDASVLIAQQTMAIFDAVASCFYSKFHYNLLRPVTYIQNVMGHTTWSASIFTPQHPAYTSTMVSAAAAGFATAAYYLGNNRQFTDDSHASLYGSWNYNSFDAIINDVKRARTVSGVNFVFSADAAIDQGKQVAARMHAMSFKKP